MKCFDCFSLSTSTCQDVLLGSASWRFFVVRGIARRTAQANRSVVTPLDHKNIHESQGQLLSRALVVGIRISIWGCWYLFNFWFLGGQCNPAFVHFTVLSSLFGMLRSVDEGEVLLVEDNFWAK